MPTQVIVTFASTSMVDIHGSDINITDGPNCISEELDADSSDATATAAWQDGLVGIVNNTSDTAVWCQVGSAPTATVPATPTTGCFPVQAAGIWVVALREGDKIAAIVDS
jgi:hypothetical protein